MTVLTNEMINGKENHDERGRVETEHLAELEQLTAHVSKHPFYRVQPAMIIVISFSIMGGERVDTKLFYGLPCLSPSDA